MSNKDGGGKKCTQSAVSVLTWAADLIWALGGADVSPVVADYKQQTSLKWLHKSTSLRRIRIQNYVMNVVTWRFLFSECFIPPLYAHVSFPQCRSRWCYRCCGVSSKLLKICFWIHYWTVSLYDCVHFTFLYCAGDTHSSTLRPRCNLTWGPVHAATLNSSPLPFSRVSGSTFLQQMSRTLAVFGGGRQVLETRWWLQMYN